jgi:hypothetical protein
LRPAQISKVLEAQHKILILRGGAGMIRSSQAGNWKKIV